MNRTQKKQEFDILQRSADCFEALGNPTRLSIYRLLVQSGESGMAVGEIQQQLAIPASTLSHHIARLVQARLVVQHRQSRVRNCCTNYQTMQQLIEFLLEKCCEEGESCQFPLARQMKNTKASNGA